MIHGESLRGIEKIESEGMGRVAVTRHALERHGEHCGTLDMNTSWKNLHRRLKCRINEIQLPSRMMLHKLRKYDETSARQDFSRKLKWDPSDFSSEK
ncbi:MAG: hypothetical protein PHF31_01465 [Methylobacter sp.]|nr:hypothetical protein [Methylobacter sp.]